MTWSAIHRVTTEGKTLEERSKKAVGYLDGVPRTTPAESADGLK